MLIEEFLPRMQDAIDRPHIEGLWFLIRSDFREAFEGTEFDDDVPDALFDLMTAFASIEPRIVP
ncbi:hypothetical protein FGL91_00025 [Microbacterium sp. CBA3102]|uniref:hypothetical protein n=1 Tax=Microbacterium sp. CBA3102 TaxID=2603598 RepID=UPI0011BB8C4B|nr:hypothetical protein [Microbacterium sp. CBA3102]QEA27075.1 hypothetical protein FGL91_00025 [Microbacterium sp. CBA3102]